MDVQALKIDKKTEAPPPFYSTFYPPPLKNGNVPITMITDPGRSGLGDKSIIVLNTFV